MVFTSEVIVAYSAKGSCGVELAYKKSVVLSKQYLSLTWSVVVLSATRTTTNILCIYLQLAGDRCVPNRTLSYGEDDAMQSGLSSPTTTTLNSPVTGLPLGVNPLTPFGGALDSPLFPANTEGGAFTFARLRKCCFLLLLRRNITGSFFGKRFRFECYFRKKTEKGLFDFYSSIRRHVDGERVG